MDAVKMDKNSMDNPARHGENAEEITARTFSHKVIQLTELQKLDFISYLDLIDNQDIS